MNTQGFKTHLPAPRAGMTTPSRNWSPAEQAEPVFLHSSFRTGSTWLWAKIRSAPTTLAYYEIFHEALATLTPADVSRFNVSSWDSRHPDAASYFLEFTPLLAAEGGILGHDRRAPMEGFIPRNGPDGELAASELAYIDHLVSQARTNRRIPVLSCTRSLGRARALRKSVGGKTIFLYRNLFHQWASYCWQKENSNMYFMGTIAGTLNAAQHDPFLKALADWYNIGDPNLPEEVLFQVFIILHLYIYSIVYDVADVLVDLTAITANKHLRYHVEQELADLIAYPIDLSDVRESCDFATLLPAKPQMLRDTIDQFAKLIPAASVSAECVAFVEGAKEAALAEWDRYEFYNRRTRAVLMKKIETIDTRRAQEATRREDLESQVSRFLTELSSAAEVRSTERAAHSAAILHLNAQQGAAEARLAAVQAEAQGLSGTLRAAQNALRVAESQTQATVQRASVAEARVEALSAQAAETSLEVEALRAAVAAKEALSQRVAVVEGEMQALLASSQASSATLEVALAKVADLEAELAEASSSREALASSLAKAESSLNATFYQQARRRLLRLR